MDSRDILILGAVGVGAYVLYRYFAGQPTPLAGSGVNNATAGNVTRDALMTTLLGGSTSSGFAGGATPRGMTGRPGDALRFQANAFALFRAQETPRQIAINAPYVFPTAASASGVTPIGTFAQAPGPRPSPFYTLVH